MFLKYASNVLQEISDECMLKAFSCQDRDLAQVYENISARIDQIIMRMGVEETDKRQVSK